MAPRAKAVPSAPTVDHLEHPLIGHAQAQAALRDAVEGERLHHGWLLHGPEGIGKARFAAQASAFLVADHARLPGDGLNLNLQHPDVRLLAQGAHPDAHWVNRQTGLDGKKPPRQIPVAAVRATLQKLQSTAAYGGWRALVIDSVDELNVEGANALLKPLEEPPHRTLVLLIAHSLAGVLPTIRSRCRPLALSPLSPADMEAWAEQHSIDMSLTVLSGGRPGIAAQLSANPDVADSYRLFCTLAGQAGLSTQTTTDRLVFTGAFAALSPENKALLLSLIEDYLSRRVRGVDEPAPFASPPKVPTPDNLHKLAEFWSEHSKAVTVRQAINVDLGERMMVLFQCLDDVYSQSLTV